MEEMKRMLKEALERKRDEEKDDDLRKRKMATRASGLRAKVQARSQSLSRSDNMDQRQTSMTTTEEHPLAGADGTKKGTGESVL